VWRDVQSVYGPDLDRVARSRFHLTRYAVLATYCGRFAEAQRVFTELGNNTSMHGAPLMLAPLIQEAAEGAATQPARGR
jgi:hypothetical protein